VAKTSSKILSTKRATTASVKSTIEQKEVSRSKSTRSLIISNTKFESKKALNVNKKLPSSLDMNNSSKLPLNNTTRQNFKIFNSKLKLNTNNLNGNKSNSPSPFKNETEENLQLNIIPSSARDNVTHMNFRKDMRPKQTSKDKLTLSKDCKILLNPQVL
jgi:hypothetical protein